MNMKNWKLGTKMATGFGLMIAMAFLIGIIGTNKMKEIGGNLNKL